MRTHRLMLRGALAAAAVTATILPTIPARADAVVNEVYHVPTVGGAVIRVEVRRDTAAPPGPVLLTYSPYNTLGEAAASTAADGVATRYIPKGYVRAVADVIGTRGSTGCWDYGGTYEQQSGVDVVRFLARQPWSNGNVGMLGTSYDGTTANMVAATGVPELKAIVPAAAISHWYGYAFYDGVRYFLNSRAPADEGFDTPLAFDFGFGLTVTPDEPDPLVQLMSKAEDCDRHWVGHTREGYSRTPDYGRFWKERDYRKDADRFRAAVMIVHGWQDYNVKQDEGLSLHEAIPVDDPETEDVVEGVPQKLLVMSQGTHSGVPAAFMALQDRFLDHYLKGVDNGVENEPAVQTLGRTSAGAKAAYTPEVAWPPPGTTNTNLYLGRSFDTVPGVPSIGPIGTTGENGWLATTPQNSGGGWAHGTAPFVSEELTLRDPLNREVARPNGQVVRGHGYYSLYHESPPLATDVRIAGRAVLDTWVNPVNASQHLTPLLVEVLPNGTLNLVERGFLNLDYRDGLAKAKPKAGWQHARVTFLPQDYTFTKNSRIGLILQGTNSVWGVPGNPGLNSYAMGPVSGVTQTGAHLILPMVNPPTQLFAS